MTRLRAAAPLLGLVLALASCGKKGSELGSVSLVTADGAQTVALKSCPTKQCLMVYVAPWCGYCRAGTPMIRELRKELRKLGMETWVVIGQDAEPALRSYAQDFGGDALLDLEQKINPSGVPHFYVVKPGGEIARRIPGLPPDPAQLFAWAVQGL